MLLLDYMYTTQDCLIMKKMQAVRLIDTLRYEFKYAFSISHESHNQPNDFALF
jgi:hypothetical protein